MRIRMRIRMPVACHRAWLCTVPKTRRPTPTPTVSGQCRSAVLPILAPRIGHTTSHTVTVMTARDEDRLWLGETRVGWLWWGTRRSWHSMGGMWHPRPRPCSHPLRTCIRWCVCVYPCRVVTKRVSPSTVSTFCHVAVTVNDDCPSCTLSAILRVNCCCACHHGNGC